MKIFSYLFCLLALAFILFFGSLTCESRLSDTSYNQNTDTLQEISESYLNYRLPNDTHPEHYDLKLTTNVHTGEKAFQGEVIITIVVTNQTQNIVLHAGEIQISQITIKNLDTGDSEELSYSYELERQFLVLKRKHELQFAASTKWDLTIAYSGQLRDDKKGFYISKYIDEDGNDRYLATTHFESTNARHAFPCYDEPAKRANFTITIQHSPTYRAISNMPVNQQLSSSNQTVFLTTDCMPTYILAFVISDFEYTEGKLNNRSHRIYSRPTAKHDHEFALNATLKMTDYFQKYLNIEFMLPKLDHVAVPDLSSGGMENWGLNVYPEKNLLFNESTYVYSKKLFVAKNMAHEIAHQWIGDLVTIQWWNQLWIKEGLCVLYSYKIMDKIYPDWNVWQSYHMIEYSELMKESDNVLSKPINVFVEKPADIAGIYDKICYYKTGAVLLMWNQALGETVFQKAICYMLKQNQYKTLSEEQFYAAIQKAAEEENYPLPAPISDMLKTWTNQGNYPLLTVTRNYANGSFSIKQETFFKNVSLSDNKTWYIPLNFAHSSNSDYQNLQATHFLTNVKQMEFDAKLAEGEWLLINKQSSGLFRINYDAKNWNLIIENLLKNPLEIHVRDRTRLIDDAYELSSTNRLNYGILLKLLSCLKHETEYAPWSAAYNIFVRLSKLLRGHEKYDDFRYFGAEQVSPLFKRIGANEIPGEHHYDRFNRYSAINLACNFEVPECLEQVSSKLSVALEDNKPIESDQEDSIYANGLRNSSDQFYNFVIQKLMNSSDEKLRKQLITSLGNSQNANQIRTFIYSSIDETNGLLPTERAAILDRTCTRGKVGFSACIEFLNTNWQAYGELTSDSEGSSHIDKVIRSMAKLVLDKQTETQFLQLVDIVKDNKYVSDSLEIDVKKTIAENSVWLHNHGEYILSWISQYRAENN